MISYVHSPYNIWPCVIVQASLRHMFNSWIRRSRLWRNFSDWLRIHVNRSVWRYRDWQNSQQGGEYVCVYWSFSGGGENHKTNCSVGSAAECGLSPYVDYYRIDWGSSLMDVWVLTGIPSESYHIDICRTLLYAFVIAQAYLGIHWRNEGCWLRIWKKFSNWLTTSCFISIEGNVVQWTDMDMRADSIPECIIRHKYWINLGLSYIFWLLMSSSDLSV